MAPSPVTDGEVSEGSTMATAVKTADNAKPMENSLKGVEGKSQKPTNKRERTKERNEDEEKSDDKEKDNEKEEKDNIDENLPLTLEINRLSWAQWCKLRLYEDEWESKSTEQKKKEIKKRKVRQNRFAIDVVADAGDLGFTEKPLSPKWHKVPCRIRINSEHIVDALNEITNVVLPPKCQILHPYKVIIDNLDGIKEHAQTLEDELTKVKIAHDSKIKDGGSQKEEMRSSSPVEGSNGNPSKLKDSKKSSRDKQSKSKGDEDLEFAREKLAHYKCFIELLETNLAPEIEAAMSIKAGTAEKILFCHLWHLFPPGETIYYQNANRDEPPQASHVLKVSRGRAKLPNSIKGFDWYYMNQDSFRQKISPFTIDAFHLGFDGKKFRLIQDKYEIPRYTGEVPITSLTVFPLRFFPKTTRDEVMLSLLNRGLNFRSLATVDAAHREYSGMTLDPEREDIHGRVIIDFKQAPFFKVGEEGDGMNKMFGLRPLSQTPDYEVEEVIGSAQTTDTSLYNDHIYDSDKTDELFQTSRVLRAPSQEMSSDDLTEDELRLLPGTVYAYVLRSRKYCKCDINCIKEISLNREAFDDLVLPKEYRTLIKSLVDRHSLGSRPVEQKTGKQRPVTERADSRLTQSGNDHQDTLSIVKGKGRGLIILLHGVPGVGKTSTAETIAEATGRPLLPVTCGDIGENAAEVEKKLEQIFTNSHRWGCVLLLDEAEVFLTKRNLQDLTRNAMVSVFLRALEFYSGILFLTTNRVGTIDEAFKSRIHISLYYPPLDWKTSKLIWKVNIRRSQSKVNTDEDELIRFAKKHFFRSEKDNRWNGRQIYNAFKTAIALAEFDKQTGDDSKKGNGKPTLTVSHLRQIAHVSKKFDDYLLETQGETTAAMNQQHKIRADAFGRPDDDIPPQRQLKRRPTKSRKIDLDELPSTSEEDSDRSDDDSPSSSEEGTESEEEVVKKSKKKKEDKKKSRKSKKSSKKPVSDSSDG